MSTDALPAPGPGSDSGPLGALPRLSTVQARLESRLAGGESEAAIRALLTWLTDPVGLDLTVGRPEVLARGAGLQRPGVIAQLTWPRLGTRASAWAWKPRSLMPWWTACSASSGSRARSGSRSRPSSGGS